MAAMPTTELARSRTLTTLATPDSSTDETDLEAESSSQSVHRRAPISSVPSWATSAASRSSELQDEARRANSEIRKRAAAAFSNPATTAVWRSMMPACPERRASSCSSSRVKLPWRLLMAWMRATISPVASYAQCKSIVLLSPPPTLVISDSSASRRVTSRRLALPPVAATRPAMPTPNGIRTTEFSRSSALRLINSRSLTSVARRAFTSAEWPARGDSPSATESISAWM
mmetsp:Transcript_15731/g.36709  ORF Transcript_15731/g.36709 Transcript_15731/m.36709 type:complete len:230 (+) Transcript_15731:1001-1690(+)